MLYNAENVHFEHDVYNVCDVRDLYACTNQPGTLISDEALNQPGWSG